MPFLSIFLITISSPTLSKQKPNTSNPQATLATVAGENIFISFILIWSYSNYYNIMYLILYLHSIIMQTYDKRHICTIILVNTLYKPKKIRL